MFHTKPLIHPATRCVGTKTTTSSALAQMFSHFVSLINTSRVLEDLHVLRGFGATGGGLDGYGVSRPALSDEDMRSRRWLKTRMESAGLNGVQVDTNLNPTLTLRNPSPA